MASSRHGFELKDWQQTAYGAVAVLLQRGDWEVRLWRWIGGEDEGLYCYRFSNLRADHRDVGMYSYISPKSYESVNKALESAAARIDRMEAVMSHLRRITKIAQTPEQQRQQSYQLRVLAAVNEFLRVNARAKAVLSHLTRTTGCGREAGVTDE